MLGKNVMYPNPQQDLDSGFVTGFLFVEEGYEDYGTKTAKYCSEEESNVYEINMRFLAFKNDCSPFEQSQDSRGAHVKLLEKKALKKQGREAKVNIKPATIFCQKIIDFVRAA